MSDDDQLWVWVIYKHPSDFPGLYVARAQSIDKDGVTAHNMGFASPDYEDIKAYMIAKGLIRIPRHPDDDPVILETWI